MLNRRAFMAGAAAVPLARPAIAQQASVLRVVPQAVLNTIDPVWSSAQIVRNLGFMVFETLYGRDENLQPHPQMLEGGLMENDGKLWTLKLREQQMFHDGTPVLARDVVASLQRWMKRDPAGATLALRMDEIVAKDDRTVVLRLNRPFPHIPELMSKVTIPPVIMPARLAATDPFKQIPEAIGSGPFRFVHNEHVLGSKAVFEKNEKYVPRNEPVSWNAGGRQVFVDRVEWLMITDGGTATNALMTGEIDWIEIPLPDLTPTLRKTRGIKVAHLDTWGQIVALRPNHMAAPTSNPAIRGAMMAAIDQKEVMIAIMGGDPDNWFVPQGFMLTGKKEVDEAGIENIRARKSPAEVKKMLDAAGYQGEKLVLLHATEHNFYNPASLIVAQQLTDAGFNVDDQPMDWGTVQSRRTNRGQLNEGGWSIFPTVTPVAEMRSPLVGMFLRGNGKNAFFGWPDDPETERMYDQWLGTTDPAEQTKLERAYVLRAYETVPFVPMGRYIQSSAWRDNVTGILKGPSIVFWNVKKG
ncbi:MAG: ABC transporter substrate-binding protein [Acetobacteraceae bacterium]